MDQAGGGASLRAPERDSQAPRAPVATGPPLPAVPLPEASPLPPPGETPPPAPSEPLARRLQVTAHEFSLTLSRPVVGAGQVTVELVNQGEDPHNLLLRREGATAPTHVVPEVASLETDSRRFDLATGTYRLWCDLEGHEAAGMKARLIVG
jgi:plastocyanin